MEDDSWKATLSHMQGIYLISDGNNGKLYVGAAYGEDAFWQRWKDYAKNGTSNNKELKKIVDEKGVAYVHNFRYSILEVYSKQDKSKDYILSREKHWKKTLLTKVDFGYNHN